VNTGRTGRAQRCMEVMGPERILPNPEEELGHGAAAEAWSGEDAEDEDDNGGYYYQPLNQDPEGPNAASAEQPEEQVQGVQDRIEVQGDEEEEEDADGAAAWRSQASIPMDADHVELVKRTMASVNLPTLGVPAWAQDISDDQWKAMVQQTLQSWQGSGSHRLERK
uniref:Male-enhanced antigen 1 n=1 Tax=Denticeps clupeoides TaxID=299321 RepID=A0AAY4E5Z2_9TELE